MTQRTAVDVILEKGRGYLYRGKYAQVHVFTKSVTDYDKLTQAFGGNVYKHRTGHLWILSHRKRLRAMLVQIAPRTSTHGFEKVIRPVLEEE